MSKIIGKIPAEKVSVTDTNEHFTSDEVEGTLNEVGNHIDDSTIHFTEESIDHNSITNTHNLTTDIDHDQLTNFVENEHIDWTNTTSNLVTTGTGTISNLTTDYIQFDTTYTDGHEEGRLQWNAEDGTLEVGMQGNNVNLQIGQETLLRVKNNTAVTIPNGSVIKQVGTTGDRVLVELAQADTDCCIVGVATEDIIGTGLALGYSTLRGIVRDINTTGLVAGEYVYLSATTPGGLTATKPDAPNYTVRVGTCLRVSETEGAIFVDVVTYPNIKDLSDVNGTPLTEDGQILTWHDVEGYFDSDKNINDYKSYAGFENRTDSTLSINSSTGVFTIAPVSNYNIYVKGSGKLNIDTSQTVTVTDDQTITFIYFDDTGTLQKSTTPWDLASGVNIPVAIVFKDGSNYALTDERHGYERNKAWHKWAHNNIGAVYNSGLTGVFTNTTLSVTQGIIYDEDLEFDTGSTQTTTSLWYRNSTSGMRMIRNSTTPYLYSTNLKYDNGSGTLQDVGANRYSTQWVYASNDSTEPIYTVIGQNNDTTLENARNATLPIINLSTAEWKLLYRVIYRNTSGTPTFIEAEDFRTVQKGVPSANITPTSHSILTDRELANSHPATAIQYDETYDVKEKIDLKQDTLVSGTNIKTVNSNSLLGSGNVSVGTVTAVNNGNGMNFTNITGSGTITLGTPSTCNASSTNAVTTSSHTHEITGFEPTITSYDGGAF